MPRRSGLSCLAFPFPVEDSMKAETIGKDERGEGVVRVRMSVGKDDRLRGR